MQNPIKNKLLAGLLLAALVAVISACDDGNNNKAKGGSLENPPPPNSADWELVWSDDFTGDLSQWDIQTGDGSDEGIPGWGNNELQYYTADNLTLEDGNLVITARTGDSPNPDYDYTSGRIRTQGKFDFTYGRVEASIQVPPGLGLWAAFWMLGSDPSPYGNWAGRGEIDILESFSREEPFAQGAMHFGMAFPLDQFVAFPNREIDPTDGFHQYAVEWDVEQVRWFIDGVHYWTVKAESYWNYYYKNKSKGFVEGSSAAPFDANQNIILNMAVGGNLPGDPSDPDVFPAQMLVEYVRVYQCPIDPANTGLGCANSIDPVDPFIITIDGPSYVPPDDAFIASYDLYTDDFGVIFEGSSSERQLAGAIFDNDGALVAAELDSGDPDRGIVLDVVTTGGGNIAINDSSGATFEIFGVGGGVDDRPGSYGGELKFDVFIFGDETAAGGMLQVKIDSGFPDVGQVEIPLDSLPKNEWKPVSVKITDILNNIGAYDGERVNIEEVLNLIVLEPTAAAHLQFDNIVLACGSPKSKPCGILNVPSVPQDVFIDAVDKAWDLGIGGSDSGSSFNNYFDGSNPDTNNKVEWQVIADEDASRGEVVQVTFNDSNKFGVWFVISSDAVIMSGFQDGAVVFDLIVDDYGSNTDGMTLKIDCFDPCTSGDQDLGFVADGVWETIEWPISEFYNNRSFDPSQVNTGLVLFPTTQRGGISFRVDNIRWEPKTDVVRPPIAYSSDFEDADLSASSIGGGWVTFVSVFDSTGAFLYNYNLGIPFPTPNNGDAFKITEGGFAGFVTGEGGPEQGDQHLAIYSDYTNPTSSSNGDIIEVVDFQETTLIPEDVGIYRLTFDAKAPVTNGITPPSKAEGFIKILTSASSISGVDRVDLSGLDSGTWQSFTLELPVLEASPLSFLLQFGFSSTMSSLANSAILVDNVVFGRVGDVEPPEPPGPGPDEPLPFPGVVPDTPSTILYQQDFEALDIDSSFALGPFGEGYQVFGFVTDSLDVPQYQYGPFGAPNGGPSFSAIATGEADIEQGGPDGQYINIYSDYNNADQLPVSDAVAPAVNHPDPWNIETTVFKEQTIQAGDSGTYAFIFDAKAPFMNGIAPPTTSVAFIKTLDPDAGFATTNLVRVDMSTPDTGIWLTSGMELIIDVENFPELEGQLLQFGWTTTTTQYNDSGVYYDNIVFGFTPLPPP